ncbi:DUF4265 domain-containing protein [Chitinibacter fontanus]|uniref:DUF4265 domain-containing protein n=1 Tax=Chitinibacter fontanus TaxID=1737446 RepID=A0A7D5Z6F2_9NEIS|nr:DUF4265 domain-containing protein [Chitinibacter fontanus]QLI81282.1 DUF4265 domain-containing protein [Chitinibacter fontanus]
MVDKELECIVSVLAGHNANGPVREELPALDLGNGKFKLLISPGLTLNLAKSDVISLHDSDSPAEVIKRGGNFAIQIYTDSLEPNVLENLVSNVEERLGGTKDAFDCGVLVFSVPFSSGLDNIREVFDEFTEASGVAWYYGNIYKNFQDPDDETLLDWWG